MPNKNNTDFAKNAYDRTALPGILSRPLLYSACGKVR